MMDTWRRISWSMNQVYTAPVFLLISFLIHKEQ